MLENVTLLDAGLLSKWYLIYLILDYFLFCGCRSPDPLQ